VAEEADSKPVSADRPVPALETIKESVSTPQASPQKAALSTPEPTPSKLVKVPAKTPDRPLPSPSKAIATPKSQQLQQRSEPQLQMTQADILRNGSEMLVALRSVSLPSVIFIALPSTISPSFFRILATSGLRQLWSSCCTS
jgi:hypothetical protein